MSNLSKAQAAWGVAPAWIIELARVCDEADQVQVGKKLGYCKAVVSQVINRKYTGSYDKFSERFNQVFIQKTLCPVLGQIDHDTCLEKQNLPFASTNSQRVQLFKTCPYCTHYQGERHASN